MIRHIIDSLKIRILFFILFAVIPAAGLIIYSGMERRRLAESVAFERVYKPAHFVSIENGHIVERAYQLLSAVSYQSDSCKPAESSCYKRFPEIISGSNLFTNIGVAAPDGRIIYSVRSVNNSGLVSDYAFFNKAVESNRFSSGDYGFNPATGISSVSFGLPVRDSRGTVTRVFFVEANLEWFSRFISEVSLPKDGIFFLFNRKGVVLSIMPPDSRRIGMPAPVFVMESITNKGLSVNRPDALFESIEPNGKPYLFMSMPIDIEASGSGIYASIGLPRETVYAEADQLLKRNVLLLIIIGSFVFTMVWVGGYLFISRKVRMLLKASRRLAAGDLKVRVGLAAGAGEFNQIAMAFDDMAGALEKRDAELSKISGSLKRSESEKAFVLDSMSELVFYVDEEMKIVWTNKAAAQFAGRPVELNSGRLSGSYCFNAFHSRAEPCDRCPVVRGIKAGMNHEEHVTSREGRIWFVHGNTLKDSNGDAAGAVVMALDITERKDAEQALSESEEQFRQLFEQNEDALILIRQKTSEIMDVNPAAVSLYGYTREELGNYGYNLFIEPKGLYEFCHWLSSVKYGENLVVDRRVNIKKDGTRIAVSYRFKYIRLQNNDVIYCSIRDITEKVRIEDETKYLQARLIQANKMTSLGMLVSGIAHEINNPNNYIMTNATFFYDVWKADILPILEKYGKEKGDISIGGLSMEEAKKDIPRMLSGISYGSRRIKGIIDDLRNFARQDKASQYGAVDLNKVMSASTAILGQQIKQYTDRFRSTCADNLPKVRGSAQQIEQVLINLIMNALQALPGRKNRVCVSIEPDTNTEFVAIRVMDEGIGISADVMERITEPFFSTKLESGGTGLGLSISNSIIREHSGTIEFESEPGRGTTVTVKLPVYKEPRL